MARLQAAPVWRRGWEWGYLRAMADQSVQQMTAPPTGTCTVSPDGGAVLCRSSSGIVSLLDSSLHQEKWSGTPAPGFGVVRFARDGGLVIVPGNGQAVLVRCSDGSVVSRLQLGKDVDALGGAVAPGGDLAAVGCNQINSLQVFSVRTGERVFACETYSWVYDADFSPDGTMLADSEFPEVVIREVGSWRELMRIPSARPTRLEPSFVRFSPDGRTLAVSVGLDVQLLDVAGVKPPRTLRGHTQRIQTLAFDATGDRLVTGSVDKTVRVWDLAGSKEPLVLLGHGAAVGCVAFVPGDAPGGQRLWSGAAEPVVRLWEPGLGRVVTSYTFPIEAAQVHRLVFSQDSRRLLGMCSSMFLELAIPRGTSIETARTAPPTSHSVADPATRSICGVELGDRVVMRDLDTLMVRWGVSDPEASRVSGLSPDGRLVVTSLSAGGVRLRSQTDGSRITDISGTGTKTSIVGFSPDSLLLATAGEDAGPARIWDLSSFRQVAEFPSDGHIVEFVVFSPDSTRIALGGADQRVHIRNLRTGVELHTLSGFNSTVWCAAFSPDGRRIAVGSQDRVARVFDADTGDELLQLRRHTGTVMSVAWSPDGRFLATGGYDQQIFIWDSAPGESDPRKGEGP
jgi:WD40 repeat protein